MVFLLFTLLILTIIYLIFAAVCYGMMLSEEGGIIEESIIEEYFNKIKNNSEIQLDFDGWKELQPLYSPGKYYNRNIKQFPWYFNLIFTYYIPDIGLVPRWYKINKQLNEKFKEGDKTFRDNKRKKLGLE